MHSSEYWKSRIWIQKFRVIVKLNGVREKEQMEKFENKHWDLSEKPDNHMEVIRRKYNDGQYKRVIGIDSGYKVWISAFIRYLRTGEGFNYERTSHQFHKLNEWI